MSFTQALSEDGAPTEQELGKGLIDAAAEAGVEHLIYSGLASASVITKGALPNECFDGKYIPSGLKFHLTPSRQIRHLGVCQEQYTVQIGCNCQSRVVFREPSLRGDGPVLRRVPVHSR